MRIYTLFLIVIFAIVFTACSTATEDNANTSNTANAENSNGQTDSGNGSETSDGSSENQTDSGSSSDSASLSPSETLKVFNKASNDKDVEKIRSVLSKETLEMVDANAKEQGKTFEELIKESDEMPAIETPEIRNEKIDGDKASIEVKNGVTGNFDSVPFVKENGVWKINFKKFIEDNMKKINEQMDIPEGN